MSLSEVVINERNRLSRTSVLTTIIAILLATWARDPLLSFKLPLSGAEIDNLTAGHAVLLGYPFLAVLIFLLAGQVVRFEQMTKKLTQFEQKYADWRFPEISDFTTRAEKCIAVLSGLAKYIAMILMPFAASIIIFTSLFDFRKCNGDPSCNQAEELNVYEHLFSATLWDKRPSYLNLNDDDGSNGNDCENINARRANVRSRLPYIYGPLQHWVYLLFQCLLFVAWWILTRRYFRRGY